MGFAADIECSVCCCCWPAVADDNDLAPDDGSAAAVATGAVVVRPELEARGLVAVAEAVVVVAVGIAGAAGIV